MNILAGLDPWLVALLIFGLRICDMAMDTIRVLFVVRGRRLLAWVLGFMQSLIFVIAISSVLANLDAWINILAYAAGFATGNVIGMLIEERLAIGHTEITIISSNRGFVIAETLRKNGTVTLLSVSVQRRDIDNVETIVLETDSDAFITADDVRPVRRGFWRA
jgi:uncharacterized protein YebE (UPF0316 family)